MSYIHKFAKICDMLNTNNYRFDCLDSNEMGSKRLKAFTPPGSPVIVPEEAADYERALFFCGPFLPFDSIRRLGLVSKLWRERAFNFATQNKEFVLSAVTEYSKSFFPKHLFSLMAAQSPLAYSKSIPVHDDFYLIFMEDGITSNHPLLADIPLAEHQIKLLDTPSKPHWFLISRQIYSPSIKQVGSKVAIDRINLDARGFKSIVTVQSPSTKELLFAMRVCRLSLRKNIYGETLSNVCELNQFIGQNPDGSFKCIEGYRERNLYGTAVAIDVNIPVAEHIKNNKVAGGTLRSRKALQF